jgi:hypothetical protein
MGGAGRHRPEGDVELGLADRAAPGTTKSGHTAAQGMIPDGGPPKVQGLFRTPIPGRLAREAASSRGDTECEQGDQHGY